MRKPSISQALKRMEKLFKDHSIQVKHSISKFPGGKIIHTYSIEVGVSSISSHESFDEAIDYYLEQLGFDERVRGEILVVNKKGEI